MLSLIFLYSGPGHIIMPVSSYVAYILANFPNSCTSNNFAYGIWVAFEGHICFSTYFAVVWYLNVVDYWVLMDVWSCVGCICRPPCKCNGTYMYNMVGIYVQGAYVINVNVCIPVLLVILLIVMSSCQAYMLTQLFDICIWCNLHVWLWWMGLFVVGNIW